MNNLLTVIHGYTRLCLDERDITESARSHLYLTQIAAAAERAGSLAEQLLRLFKESETSSNKAVSVTTILIVDDDESVRQLIERVLVIEGYAVLTAITPNDAVDICMQTRNVDLLITDMTMPGMSGYDLAQAIFKLQPSAKALLISGYPQTIAGDEPRMSFLAKPFLPRQLIATVQSLVS